MRAWIVSDLHISPMDTLLGTSLHIPVADICICAGDISNDIATSITYLLRTIEPHMPVVLTLGNHDFYGSSIDYALEKARRLVRGSRIHLLENETIEIDGCRFIGASLWTDFAVSVGDDEHIPPEERRAKAFELVPWQMADFHAIFRSDERRPSENGLVTVHEIIERHIASQSFIDQQLSKPFDGRTVVVTHHAPHMQSMDPSFFGHVTNAAFASDLSGMIERRKPHLWIHGHIHKFRDYMADATRVICNPRGYRREHYLSGFRDDLVVDL